MKLSKGNYNAIVCRLTNVRPHPNADRMLIANALGYEVIVGLGSKDGDLGIVFPEGGKLSHEMLMANNLYRKNPVTGEPMGGYFNENGRVRAVKLRGASSEAFFTKVGSLHWTTDEDCAFDFNEGDEFDVVNGARICEKYYTPATQRAMQREAKAYKKPWWLPRFLVKWHRKLTSRAGFDPCPTFAKHFNTPKLRQSIHVIEPGYKVILTSKRHGTSGRTGLVPYRRKTWLGIKSEYKYVTGTRNVVKYPDGRAGGYYESEDFRGEIHDAIATKGLKEDEIVYYEILGFSRPGSPIMPNHKLVWKDFKGAGFSKEEYRDLVAKYGETVTYHYGNEDGQYHIEVYRITQGGRDLSAREMTDRCWELGLPCVPYLTTRNSDDDLMDICAKLSSGSDEEPGQLREGICVRLETWEGEHVKTYKYKGNTFCVLEGIKRNDVNYVDMEEIS